MPETVTQRATRRAKRQPHLVENAAVRLDAEVKHLELEAAVRALERAEQAGREWAEAIDALRRRVFELLDWGQEVHVPGCRLPIKRSVKGKSVKWDGPRAASMVAARAADEAVDATTGEVMPVGAICELVASEIVDCAGLTPSKAWRKDSLRTRGINPDVLVEETGGTHTVRWCQ